MIRRIDFTNCELSGITYSGAEEKIGIKFNGVNYMLKFNKKTIFGERYSDISEYLGSIIFNMLGIESQETKLGYYKGRKVVACKDLFVGKIFKPFSDLGESSIDSKEKYSYSFKEIELLIKKSSRVVDKQLIINTFWKIYVVDALLANPDRHNKNWGFIKENGQYKICPVFDNGSSLFPSLIDEEEINNILNDEEELRVRVEDEPNSIIRIDSSRSDYLTVISSKQFDGCNNAIKEIYPLIKMDEIDALIDGVDMSVNRKKLIKAIINKRYEIIIKHTYEELETEWKK